VSDTPEVSYVAPEDEIPLDDGDPSTVAAKIRAFEAAAQALDMGAETPTASPPVPALRLSDIIDKYDDVEVDLNAVDDGCGRLGGARLSHEWWLHN
jgi:hypothetical protein